MSELPMPIPEPQGERPDWVNQDMSQVNPVENDGLRNAAVSSLDKIHETPQPGAFDVGSSALSSEVDISPATKLGVIDGEFNVKRSDGSDEKGWTVVRSAARDNEGRYSILISKPNPNKPDEDMMKKVPASMFISWQETSAPSSEIPVIDLESQADIEKNRIQAQVDKIYDDLSKIKDQLPEELRVTVWDFGAKSARSHEVADLAEEGKYGPNGHRNAEDAVADALDAERKVQREVPREFHTLASDYKILMVNKYKLRKQLEKYK